MPNLALKVNKKLKINQNTISKISRIGVNFLTSQPHQRPEGHVIIFFSIEKQGLESKVLPATAEGFVEIDHGEILLRPCLA